MVPPVPIPNTVVKHINAEGTWLETAWEIRELPVRGHVFAKQMDGKEKRLLRKQSSFLLPQSLEYCHINRFFSMTKYYRTFFLIYRSFLKV